MNRYARLRWLILITCHFVRGFWLYSKRGNEQSFYFGYKNPGETEDVVVLTCSVGRDTQTAREMISHWKDGVPQ